MPKVKILHQFNLPEERIDLETLLKADDFKAILWDLDQWLREQIKYGNKNELQPARDQLWELINEYGVKIE